ncbi:MAG: alpha/beta hydrolase [Actinomycetota bacterium]
MTELQQQGLAPSVEDGTITFRLRDPDKELKAVRLYQEIVRPRSGPPFDWADGVWVTEFPLPEADRMEYLIEIFRDRSQEMVTDPNNPERAPGPFGDKSVITFGGYQPPAWLTTEAPPGTRSTLSVRSRPLRTRLEVELWSPPGSETDEPLPLLVAHDGPEYDRYSSLTTFLAAAISEGRVPRARAALVPPHDRNQTYSASAAYARTFAHDILPAILADAPTPHGRKMRIGMGASLGGLSMLNIHRRSPAAFGGLFLQSGSYFRQRYDAQESGFERFRRISRFMGEVLTAEVWAHPVPVTMTCGRVEENLANNRATCLALSRQGYDIRLVENRDAHNWIAWRDTLDPHLSELMNKVWG